jgi:hypothetical protein
MPADAAQRLAGALAEQAAQVREVPRHARAGEG